MVQPLAPLKIPDPNAGRRRLIIGVGVVLSLIIVLVVLSTRLAGSDTEISLATSTTVADTTSATVVSNATAETACTLDEFEIEKGDVGDSVTCAQIALVAAGYNTVEINGVFDDATDEATRAFQTDFELYVDGIIGKVTATELGVWPGLEAFVVRTPVPAPGAVDLSGMPLSPVASAGSDAPELPDDAGQGTGKRVVYERSSQRVWAIDDDEQIVRYTTTHDTYSGDSSDNCAICSSSLAEHPEGSSESFQVSELPCGHTFHYTCISRHFRASVRCPLCVRDVRDGSSS